MRILVQQKGGPSFWLGLPTRLLFCRTTARLVSGALQKYAPAYLPRYTSQQLHQLFLELLRIKKKYRRLELLDIRFKDGAVVRIRL
ncbi:hypothetical protein H8K20_00260 [Neobittarella massiliensis]|uniref:Uncharacterized protein n=1 Tax=Neobittarella massiliensis (ex Bilen et al. 2018) TaxID=2041842 RepID=A0A8J6IK02_9FIRM|nr:hypothetical protein [Neobittarella massiliensis]MBC3514824.1 hypothetical protein [Neobittarella massiliensis]